MKRALLLTAVLLGSLTLLAQTEGPPIDIYGAYSHVSNFDVGQSGWLASANYDVNHWLGIEGDLSGAYGHKNLGTVAVLLPGIPSKINSRMHSFNAGPRITYRPTDAKWNGFGHLLFGVSHTNVSATGVSDADTSFSWLLGAGGTYYFADHLGARAQLDLLRTNFFSKGDWHPRIGLGVVYRFGSK